MTPEEVFKARLVLAGYFTTHALIDVMIEGLADEREDVEIWALESIREFGRLRKKYHAAKLTDYELMMDYIAHLEVAAGIR